MKKFSRFGAIAISLFAILFMYQESKAGTTDKPGVDNTQSTDPDIHFTVSMPQPWTHLLEVEMRVKWNALPNKAEFKMPVWTPGSYLVREYARHVQNFSAKDAAGKSLPWQKTNKNTWQIETGGAREVVLSYKVYSNELTVRTNELNDEHAFWNNGALLLFPKGQIGAPSLVTVKPYGNWKIATGLRPVAGQPNTFRAENYDILYDSPFEVSNFNEISFTAAGKPHRLVITGEGNYDMKQIAEDTAKIADAAMGIFGELPTEDYLIIVNLRGGGGLEHLNSTALQWNRFGFQPRARYIGFLNLVAHEYFHLWNVKRIRPDALGPFDYENENYTKMLWVAEGTTSYYENVLLRRAGIINDAQQISILAGAITQLQNRPGRFETSLEEASLDAWIKYYRQDQNAVNNQISYYDKGDIVSMMLDMTIRNASGGKNSLDTVMKYLYDEFYRKDRNYTPEDFQKACELAAGQSLNDFFSKYVRGRDEIDYNSILNGFGLQLNAATPQAVRAYLGATVGETDGRLLIRAVPAGTPAYEQGLNFNDQIVAIDGHRASNTFLQSYLGQKKPGDTVSLTIFRFDKLREVEIKLGSDTRITTEITPVRQPSEKQRQMYESYFGTKLR